MYVKNLVILFAFLTLPLAFTSNAFADGTHESHSNISNGLNDPQAKQQQQDPIVKELDSHNSMTAEQTTSNELNNHDSMTPEQHEASLNSDPHGGMNHGDVHESTSTHRGAHAETNVSSDTETGHGEQAQTEATLEEVSPNYIVLGTFGTINLAFLGLGFFWKTRKRKEQSHETF